MMRRWRWMIRGASNNEDTPVTIDVVANDSDVDGDGLTVQSVTQPSNGSVVNNGTDVTYTPDADWSGTDSFTYTVTDGVLTDTATVTVTVAAVNDAPVAVDDPAATTNEDTAATIDVLANDSDVDLGALSVDSVTQPVNGIVVNNGTDVTYTPDADFNGTDTFTYTITDGALTDTATVTVTVNAINDAPVATDDPSVGTNEDTAVVIDVAANDTDIDGDSLAVQVVTQPANGFVVNNGTDVTYTPDANFNGTDTFTYTVTDGALTDAATVTVTVAAVNDAPIAISESQAVDEDNAVVVDALVNDFDVDLDSLTVDSVTQPANGTVVNNGSDVTYTPDPDFNGTDTFTYTVTDGALTDTATVTVTVNPINDAPTGTDDPVLATEDVVATFDLLVNDVDVDLDVLSIDSVAQPANGTVTNNGTDVTYTPNPDFNGTDTFTYTITDGTLTDTATVTVTVDPVNDAPATGPDGVAATEDTSIVIDVLANDSDVDLDALTVGSVTQPANGTVVNNGGDLSYAPDPDFFGVDSFTYTAWDGTTATTGTVTVSVAAVNDAPRPAADRPVVSEDGMVAFDPLANDVEVDGDTMNILSVGIPANGSLVANGDGTFTYQPDPDFAGTDTFSYTVGDGTTSASAQIRVTVTAVNDAPVAVDDTATVTEGEGVVISVDEILANDVDVDTPHSQLSVEFSSNPTNGDVSVLGGASTLQSIRMLPGQTVVYGHDGSETSADEIRYRVWDGAAWSNTASILVGIELVDEPPTLTVGAVSVAENAAVGTVVQTAVGTDPEGADLTYALTGTDRLRIDPATGAITVQRALDYESTPTITYTVSVTDGGGNVVTETVVLTVTDVNERPTVAGATFELSVDSATGAVLGTVAAFDPDGDAVRYSLNSSQFRIDPVTGVLTVVGGLDNLVGQVLEVTVNATDPDGLTATATVAFIVSALPVPQNLAPIVVDDAVTTDEDTPVVIYPLANDTDPEGGTLTIVQIQSLSDGDLTPTLDGGYRFMPPADWHGTANFFYVVQDPQGVAVTGNITVNVLAVNDAPRLDDITQIIEFEDEILIEIPQPVDPEGDDFEVRYGQPENGDAAVDEDGSIRYKPFPGFSGVDEIIITLIDEFGAEGISRIIIDVTAFDAGVAAINLVSAPISVDVPDSSRDVGGFLSFSGMELIFDRTENIFAANRIPILVFLIFAALSLYVSLRRSSLLGTGPVYLPAGPRFRGGIVMAASAETVPVYEGPDLKDVAIHRFEAAERDIEVTGELAQTGGRRFAKVQTAEGVGWVDVRFVADLAHAEPGSMPAASEATDALGSVLANRSDMAELISPRGMFVALGDASVVVDAGASKGILQASASLEWQAPGDGQPVGPFSKLVAAPLEDAMQLGERGQGVPEGVDAPVEVRNFPAVHYEFGDTVWCVSVDLDGDTPKVAGIWRV